MKGDLDFANCFLVLEVNSRAELVRIPTPRAHHFRALTTSVAQLVRALHRNRRAAGLIPASSIFATASG